MSSSRLVTWITFLAVFAMAAQVSLDTDTWWHLRAGTWMLEHRAILQADPFSYTRAGAVWQYPGWLVQIPMAWMFQTFGPGGLNVWTAGMVTLAFVLVWQVMEGGPFVKAFIVILGAAVTGVYWSARPYLVTFVLAAAFLWILEDFRSGKKDRLLWLPVLMMVWANSHGGFAVGFILWGVYGLEVGLKWLDNLRVARFPKTKDTKMEPTEVDTQQKNAFPISNTQYRIPNLQSPISKMLILGLCLTLAVCLNPSGPVMLLYPFKTVAIEALQDYIQEWQSPNFHNVQFQPFAWMLLLTIGAVGTARKGLSWVDFLLVSGFAYLGLLAARNVALFGLVATVVLARHAEGVVDRVGQAMGIRLALRRGRVSVVQGWVNRMLLVVLVLLVVVKTLSVFPVSENEKVFRRALPVEAVAFLQESRPAGRLFNSYNWGAYLLWMLPESPVFVDGRTDLYNDEIIGQWFQVVRAEEGWQDVLVQWDVQTILLEAGSPVLSHLEGEGWQKLYEDEMAVVYAKEK